MKYTLGNSSLEVNGKQYLKDVGGYNGTNKDSSKDVATVIEDVVTEIGGKINSMLSVNYFELVNLRDNGQLIPGQQYRLTDYITTTSQENTVSAGHQFDIIVTANSNNTLNEIASACLHEGDTYFSEHGVNLSAWQIWYRLDDDGIFEWDMGYFYDSDNNLYEFKNWVTAVGKVCDDQIDSFYETEINEKFSHFNYTENLDGIIVPTLYGRMLDGDTDEGLNTSVPYHYKGVYNVDGQEYDAWAELSAYNGIVEYATDENGNPVYVLTERTAIGRGVIYRMIDENGNDCPYDFKNIKFTKPIISETDTPDSNFYYTFSFSDSNIYDSSVYNNGGRNIKDNVIKPFYSYAGATQALNRILFISSAFVNKTENNTFEFNCNNNIFGTHCSNNTFGNSCSSNKFGNNFKSNTFGTNCHSNTFGNSCYNNKFGTNCHSNTFGNYCYDNTFGTNCHSNTFGTNCYDNTFGNACNSNTFGNECIDNTFGNACNSNTFGKYCQSNTFGNWCNSNTFGILYDGYEQVNCSINTFGNWCVDNTFGTHCCSITFGNGCDSNTFGNWCNSNTFGDYCNSNTFGDYCGSNTFGNYCYCNIFGTTSTSPKSYYENIIFDSGNSYIKLNCDQITSSTKRYQNVRIGLGVNNTGEYKTIKDSNVNQTYETLYRPKGSDTKTV